MQFYVQNNINEKCFIKKKKKKKHDPQTIRNSTCNTESHYQLPLLIRLWNEIKFQRPSKMFINRL